MHAWIFVGRAGSAEFLLFFHPCCLQLPLGPSLPRFLLCFHAINLPFCVLNAVRLAARRAPGLASPQQKMLKSLSKGRPAGKIAWE